MSTPDRTEIESLLAADSEELESLLGLYALSAYSPPLSVLTEARAGALQESLAPTLGKPRFSNAYLKSNARWFFKMWAKELRQAICTNKALYKQEREATVDEVHVLVATIVGAIVAAAPALAPLTGLLAVLGVIIAKSGTEAFCKSL